jgi:hypothetical protein
MLRAKKHLRSASPALGLLALSLLPLAGCDNPACVFSSVGCQGGGGGGGGGGLGTEEASLPLDGSWISPSAPTIELALPSLEAHPESVVAVRFSESINPTSLTGAFLVVETVFGTPVPLVEPPPLTGDGRVAILAPLASLQNGSTYTVQFAPNAAVTDLTGQVLAATPGEITSFAVVDSAEPQVIASFPPENSASQSDLTEIAVVFDRKMSAGSFDLDSWVVTVGGAPPVDHDDDPTPLLVAGGALPVPITQVWTWANVDDAGQRISHGTGATLALELSPPGNAILSNDGSDDPLPGQTLEFELASFGVPREALKPFAPTAAIGLPDIGGVDPLLQVELTTPAQAGDTLDLFLFGEGRVSGELTAFARSMAAPAGSSLVDVLPGTLALLSEGLAIFADGELTIGVRTTRGGVRLPLRLADADPLLPGPQPFVFDVTPPVILGLGTSGATVASFRSDQRDIVIVGRASEAIGAVRVSAGAAGDNFTGTEKPVVVADDGNGLFVARPVPAGILDPFAANPTYDVRVFDRAFNGSTSSVTGTYRQLGVAAAGAALPGPANLTVDVFDAETLTLLSGVLVMTHQDDAGITELGSALTNASGFASVPAAPSGRTIVTLDRAGYDLFTFHGVPRERMQIPLQPTGTNNATSAGEVLAAFPAVDLTGLTVAVGDGRFPFVGPRWEETDSCSVNPQTLQYECDFGPLVVRPRRLGHQTALAADFNVTLPTFSAATFLRAFTLRSLARDLNPGQAELFVELELPASLIALGPEGQAIAADPHVLNKAGAPNLGVLSSPPRISVEGLAPAQANPVVVGLGAAFTIDADNWNVVAAYPGAADGIDDGGGDELGSLVTTFALEPDLFLRAELFDDDGNRVGARPRFSTSVGALVVPDPPRLLVPGPGGSTGGASYNLVAADVLPDALGWEGLYRAQLTDATGRSWQLWTSDPPDAAGGVTLHVPDIGSGTLGGNPLAAGPITCVVSAHAWSALDVAGAGFLWSDVAREVEVYGHTLAVQFTQN